MLWGHPDGREMNDSDWHDGGLPSVGMLLEGNRIQRRDARGNRLTDDTFFVIFNKGAESIDFSLPGQELHEARGWIMALNSIGAEYPIDTYFEKGSSIKVPGRTVWVLKADDEEEEQ